jgi:hypothetical protein
LDGRSAQKLTSGLKMEYILIRISSINGYSNVYKLSQPRAGFFMLVSLFMGMRLDLKRVYKGETYTIGKLSIDGEFFCNTLEDKVRISNCDCKQKIPKITAIPEGTYKIDFLFWEKHNDTYPHLIDVPCFSGILIHSGTTDADTEGCILVGINDIKGKLLRSRLTWLSLMAKIKREKDLTIIIQ